MPDLDRRPFGASAAGLLDRARFVAEPESSATRVEPSCPARPDTGPPPPGVPRERLRVLLDRLVTEGLNIVFGVWKHGCSDKPRAY